MGVAARAGCKMQASRGPGHDEIHAVHELILETWSAVRLRACCDTACWADPVTKDFLICQERKIEKLGVSSSNVTH